jgi:hypothetical protein
MSNVSIGWDQTAPADSDGAGAGAAAFRSLKSNIQGGLGAEHDWPTINGNAGAHKLGSARIHVGASSAVSSADTTGRMMFNSTLSQLVYLNSTASVIVGGRGSVQATALLGSSMTQYPAMDVGLITGLVTVKSSNVTSHQAFGVSFATTPILTHAINDYQVAGSSGGILPPYIQALDASGFTLAWNGPLSTSTVTLTIGWHAVGKVAYP